MFSPTPAALCKAVSTLEDTARIARRVLGGAHPSTEQIEVALRKSRAALDKLRAAIAAAEARAPNPPPPNILQRIPKPDLDALRAETAGSFQRASEEKLRTRRIVSVADRFRRSAPEAPGGDDSRSTLTVDSQQPPPSEPAAATPDSAPSLADVVSQFGEAVSDGKFRAAVPDSEPDEGAVNPWLADQISKSAAEA